VIANEITIGRRKTGGLMRLTPAQIAVHLISGNDPSPPGWPQRTLREQLQDGREMLRSMSGQDFGFDLQKWHDYLKESKDGGYTWNRTIDLPKVMQRALANQEWLDTVAAIEDAANRVAGRVSPPSPHTT
jgi:hypothetical protein